MSLLPERVATRPVVGALHTHWHYVIGMGEWSETDDTVLVAHENHAAEMSVSLASDSPWRKCVMSVPHFSSGPSSPRKALIRPPSRGTQSSTCRT